MAFIDNCFWCGKRVEITSHSHLPKDRFCLACYSELQKKIASGHYKSKVPCDRCGGTGKQHGHKCANCSGSGQLVKDECPYHSAKGFPGAQE